MAFKNTAVVKVIVAWDTVNNVYKTGDAANITTRGVGDGAEFTPAAPNVTEIDSTNLPGRYSVALAAGENNYHTVALGGKSSTSGIAIFGPQWDNEMNANLVQILATALTETVGGYLTGAFKKLFDVTTPVLTAASVNQTEDNATRLTNLQSRVPAALTGNGNMKSSLVEILTTALTETAGQLAGGFKKFFNIGTPAATMDHLILVDTLTTYTGNTVQTGDSYARIGAPVGASISADIAEIEAETDDIAAIKTKTDSLTFTSAGKVDANMLAATASVIANAVWDAVMSSHVTALSTGAALNAAGAAGDPWTTALPGAYGAGTAGSIIGNIVASILNTALTQSYASLHAVPTLTQLLCEVRSILSDFSISGTTITTKEFDGSTTATTATLDDATTPTSRTRAT